MRSDPPRRIVSSIYDAALVPDLWPSALQSIVDAAGAVGAAYLVWNKRTRRGDLVSQSGPLVGAAADYLSYYHELDGFRPMVEVSPSGRRLRLSECLPEAVLRRDEMYNDYLLKHGIGDVLAVRLLQSATHTVMLGLHQGTHQAPFAADRMAALQELLEMLGKAARLHTELSGLGSQASLTLRALDHVAAGVIVTDGDGRVIEMNLTAERIARRDDGLTVRQGILSARRVFENAQLVRFIAAAAEQKTAAAMGRMLVGRRGGRPAYALTVAPLGAELGVYQRPLAIIFVADPDERSPSETELAELFGLSPSESRLAVALLAGKRLRDVAVEFGVRITTLRTQLSFILKKVGVERQVDLVRVLSHIPVITARIPETE
jgi:DNA-binding CsgD family transcriptional regulator/PAS domain-containing protein